MRFFPYIRRENVVYYHLESMQFGKLGGESVGLRRLQVIR